MGVVIRGGRLIDPAHHLDATRDIFIEDGFVSGIGEAPAGFQADEVIEARGRIVCPGLVDLCARLREPGQEYKATIESETLAAVAGGITTLCCPPDTDPVIDTPAMAQMIQSRAWQVGRAFIHPLGALTRDLMGELLTDMAALDEAGCAGFSNAQRPIKDTAVLRHAMEYAASFGLTVFLQADDPWLSSKGVVHEGEVATRLGLPGIPEAAEVIGVARNLALIEQTGVRAHFSQLSTAKAVAMIAEAKRQGLPVTADVTAHHLHLTEHDIGFFNTQCYVLPPLRTQRDREALRQALASGAVTAVCSDHQPHELDAKLAPFSDAAPGVSALETLLPLMLKLVDDGLLSLSEAIALLTVQPAGIIGVEAGHLGVGATADICIFDPDRIWALSEDAMVSQGRNTPFLGWEFRGRVTQTLVGGEVVFDLEKQAPRDRRGW